MTWKTESYRENILDRVDWVLMSVDYDDVYCFAPKDRAMIIALGYQLKDIIIKAQIRMWRDGCSE